MEKIYVVSRLYTDNTSMVMRCFKEKAKAHEYAMSQNVIIKANGMKYDDDDCEVETLVIEESYLD